MQLPNKNYSHLEQQWVLHLDLEEEKQVGELHRTNTNIVMQLNLDKYYMDDKK